MPINEPTLRKGSRGDAVVRLQEALTREGYAPDAVDGVFGSSTEESVKAFQAHRRIRADGVVGPTTWLHLCTPRYEPGVWNDQNGIQLNNNCYNYACDLRTGTFAQPGTGSGSPFANTDCADISQAAVADGLLATDCDGDCGANGCCHQVALVIWPGVDFHWYRRDIDGTWSHKPGSTAARNVDHAGQIINDPRTAARGPYTDFCGCFCACKGNLRIR